MDADAIPADMEGCDIGPKTREELFANAVQGRQDRHLERPDGRVRNPTPAAGTLAVAQAMADSDAVTIIGGGDSAAAVEQMGLGDKIDPHLHRRRRVLEYLEGKVLRALPALTKSCK